MTDYARLERTLVDTLHLTRRPVAIAFRDAPPEGVTKFEGSQPSGCSFWRLAAEGRAFYTVQSDHYNCPVGSYTHNIPLPAARQHELTATLGLMSEIGYLRMEEVPGIPRLARLTGVFAEPAASAVFAGAQHAVQSGLIKPNESAALLVTGNGLKDIKRAQQSVAQGLRVQPTIDSVRQALHLE